MTPLQIKMFWSKVNKNGPVPRHQPKLGKCWNWSKGVDSFGYGWLKLNNVPKLAHRVSWELTYGAVGIKGCVLHQCDNPRCVNPKHLFLGSRSDNVTDMVGKMRHAHLLTAKDVRWIRKHYIRRNRIFGQPALARRFNVSQRTISAIVNRQTWKHLK